MDGYHFQCKRKLWLFVILILFIMDCYFNVSVYYYVLRSTGNRKLNYMDYMGADITRKESVIYYKYPLNNSVEVSMDYTREYNSSYYWFIAMKHLFKNIGYEEAYRYPNETALCNTKNMSTELIFVNKTERKYDWIEKQNPDVKLGGYYAPAHCRAKHRVAVIVPYRDRRVNLSIFLRYLHPLLKKQLLEYRIFVIEQYGHEKFNKGTLYNIAFLETQRFGTWHCLIFHDVDLIPEDERISYSCPEHPTHMSPAVESWGYIAPYRNIFGGVTALTPAQFESVNGYSNFYWNWGAEDDDFYGRLQSKNYTVLRYNSSIARYATLSHTGNEIGKERTLLLMMSRLRYQTEGLITTKYNLVRVTKEKLYTHILADVNPIKMKLDTKSLMQRIIHLNGKTFLFGGKEYKLANPHML